MGFFALRNLELHIFKEEHPTDLNATIAFAMGLPLDHIEYNSTGRPFQVANKTGKPLTALF